MATEISADHRKREESEFHDRLRAGQNEQRWSRDAEARVADDPLWSNFRFYAIEQDSLELMRSWVSSLGRGGTVLDYCCGNGEESVRLAAAGAEMVHGIDISPISVQNATVLAARHGVSDRVRFQTMDAEALAFPDNSFDLVMEYGVLHHLDLPMAMAELARVVKPGGAVVCTETLGHNPVIQWYRRRTPELRTAWEVDHILVRKDFKTLQRYFRTVELRFFHLAALAAVPLRHTRAFAPVLRVLRGVDRVLLSIPGFQWQAWQVVFKLSDPIKEASGVGGAGREA